MSALAPRGEALLAAVRAAAVARDGELHLWWLGQSGFLVQWQGSHLLLDPYLSDSLTRKYAATDRPHVPLMAPLVAPEGLDFIQVVTASHQHTDHLDPDTLRPLVRANPGLRLVAPEAWRRLAAERAGIGPEAVLGMDAGMEAAVGAVRITALPSAHETVEVDGQGHCRALGYVLQLGPWRLYHAGDTVAYPELAARLRVLRVDVALLPINGRDPARGVPGNLTGPEAAELAHAAGIRLVIPCHYGMFAFNTASPEPFAAAARALGQPYAVLQPGSHWSSVALSR